MRTFVAATILLATYFSAFTASAEANAGAAPSLVKRNGSAMGTEVNISVYTADEEGADRAIAAAFEEITRIENLMTTWKPDSEVSRINAAAGDHPVAVSDDTLAVIEMAQRASALSGGAFDITFYALHGLWKFDEDMVKKLPNRAEVLRRLKLVDYRQLKVDPVAKTVFLTKKGMGIGLGGIAKGYAVDRAVAVLRKAGFVNAIVQAGGDLMCAGSKDGQPWTAGIRDPRGGPLDVFATLQLIDHAFSTAGDYERFYFIGKKRYHHIIDPKTGFPATKSRSVTIYAPTALLADALDDAVFIMGWQKGLEMIESVEGVGAIVVDDKGQVHTSKRVQGKVQIVRPPTNEP